MGKSTKYAIERGSNASPRKRRRLTQHERFIEAARELGANESEDAFKNTLRQLATPKPDKPDKL